MTSLRPFRFPAFLAVAVLLASAPARATLVTHTIEDPAFAAAKAPNGDILRSDDAGPTKVIRSDGTIPTTRLRWGLRLPVTTSSSEPIFEAVTARGPVFRTITLRSPNGTPFVAYPEPALPRYLGAAAPSQTRRLPIATEAELPQEGSTGQTEPTASGALDLGGLGLSAFDPHSGHSFGPGGASENHYESFNQTVAAGPVGRWSPEFLGARSNAAERSASVRIPTGTVDPVVTGDPLLFRDVVAEEQDEEQPVENVDVSVPIPEPTTALFGFALLAVTASGRRRLRASAKR